MALGSNKKFEKIEINPRDKLFRWGPIEALPIYVDFWHKALINCKKAYGSEWPQSLEYFKDEKLIFITDSRKVYDNGEKIFSKHILTDNFFKKNYQKWEKIAKEGDTSTCRL